MHLARSSFLCNPSFLEVGTPLTQDGAADSLHARVERRNPILIDLGYHRRLARSQLTRDLVKKIRADTDVEKVAAAPKQYADGHANNNASRPAECPDHGADQTADRRASQLIRRFLYRQLAARIFGDNGQSIEREISLCMKFFKARVPSYAFASLVNVVARVD